MSDEYCTGPPCPHFPEWIKAPEEARDYLVMRALVEGAQVNYVSSQGRRIVCGRPLNSAVKSLPLPIDPRFTEGK